MRMFVLVIVAAFTDAASAGPVYRCDNARTAERTWQDTPCPKGLMETKFENDPNAPEPRDDAKEMAALRDGWRRTYSKYCTDLGYDSGHYECVRDQVDAAEWIITSLKEHGVGTVQRAKLDLCLKRYHNVATDVVDARGVRTCYTLP